MKLNLGAGDHPLEGYENIDAKTGATAYPLGYDDGTIDEVRASHILEHFSHHDIDAVLAEWVRVLKPGGRLRVAVPDFEDIAKRYLRGSNLPIEGFIMGGQADEYDHHSALFDRHTLHGKMARAGLVGIAPWKSTDGDCSQYPISLNLEGYKRPASWPATTAVMSVPRLGFMDNYFAAFEALAPLKIGLRKTTGAFWGQCLTRAIEETFEEGDPDYILTIDYDSVYTRRDVESLLSAAMRHPEADAIAPLQSSRSKSTPMMTIRDEHGNNRDNVPLEEFDSELIRCATAHFGLTLIKASALRSLPRPWFLGVPDDEGRWGDDKIDDDVHFWKQWEAAGLSLYTATRVPIGHAELMVRWPGSDLSATYQHPSDFWKDGKPEDVWQ